MCRSAVNDESCSPWVMCSCSVVSGNQIRDKYAGRVSLNVRCFNKQKSKTRNHGDREL